MDPATSPNSRIVSAHQPTYLPWLGLLHKIWLSDLFVVFDCVSFEKGSFINRNRLLSPSAGWSWLTVPVSSAGPEDLHSRPINLLATDDSRSWKRKHLAHIRHAYRQSPQFNEIYPAVESFYADVGGTLTDVCVASTVLLLDLFGIRTPIVRSSSLGLIGEKDSRVLNLATKTSADVFVFGTLGKNYADKNKFIKNGVYPYFQCFSHPVYPQRRNSEFLSGLSALDFLFSVGSDLVSAFGANARKEDLPLFRTPGHGSGKPRNRSGLLAGINQ